MDQRICVNESIYHLTYGKVYSVLDITSNPRTTLRIADDHGRNIWVPDHFFVNHHMDVPKIDQVVIRDPVASTNEDPIEVEVYLSTGERRWCYFVHPRAFGHFGDSLVLDNRQVFVYQAPHQIVVTQLSLASIEGTLDYLLRNGRLIEATRAF